ncbi:MAG: CapA family protein [Niabella sp.]|nr:CapA family protein [Niabella sp.]
MRLLFIFGAGLIFAGCKNQGPDPNETATKKESVTVDSAITITAVGDLMLGADYPNRSRMPKHNILLPLADSLKNSHFLIGNIEGVITDSTIPEKKCPLYGSCYVFRMPPGTEKQFKNAGFDFLNLANNHSGDFGTAALAQTMQLLDRAGIAYAGIRPRHSYKIISKNHIRYGIIGVGFGWRHLQIAQPEAVVKQIKKIRDSTDILMVFFHGGAEGDTTEHVTRNTEVFRGENRGNVYAFARSCIDAGADLVLGSGPHVTRGIELYKQKLIAYSLGNYATFGAISLKGPMGMAPILKIRVNRKGDFINGRIISTRQLAGDDRTPQLDPTKKVIGRMQLLSKLDFPESPLTITQKGDIIIKNF